MLRFESVFWATRNSIELQKKFTQLGFNVQTSIRDPHTKAVYFGPEAIEIFSGDQELATLKTLGEVDSFLDQGDGIYGIGLESDNIVSDYKRLALNHTLEKPRKAIDTESKNSVWAGFSLPREATEFANAWIFMNAPQVLKGQAQQILPLKHPNTCFGVESIHIAVQDPDNASKKWAQILSKNPAGLNWNELAKTSGKRFQLGERFFDLLKPVPNSALSQAANNRDGVFMLTLKVVDLVAMKDYCLAAGLTVTPCQTRDGFVVPSSFLGGPALRFVRAFWKRYVPTINDFYPYGRRPDSFRPLGGANSTTLSDDFSDNWKY